jgi:hypothetical protein
VASNYFKSEPGFSGLEMDDEDISNLPIFPNNP